MRRRLPTMVLLLGLPMFAPRLGGAEPPAGVARPRDTQAQRHKMQGRVLMSLGIIHLIGATIAGAVMLGEQQSCHPETGCRNEDLATPIAAFTTVAIGGIFSAIGIPLYVSGANGVARQTLTAQSPLLTVAF
jgi:hypothetical protein